MSKDVSDKVDMIASLVSLKLGTPLGYDSFLLLFVHRPFRRRPAHQFSIPDRSVSFSRGQISVRSSFHVDEVHNRSIIIFANRPTHMRIPSSTSQFEKRRHQHRPIDRLLTFANLSTAHNLREIYRSIKYKYKRDICTLKLIYFGLLQVINLFKAIEKRIPLLLSS